MSKIGNLPIEIPEGVEVVVSAKKIEVTGAKGKLSFNLDDLIRVEKTEGVISVSVIKDTKYAKSIWGTTRKLISNMIIGVSKGWSKQLELIGTGYKAEVQGNTLILTVGYSHPVKVDAPSDITFKVEKNVKYLTEIVRRKAGKAAKAAA